MSRTTTPATLQLLDVVPVAHVNGDLAGVQTLFLVADPATNHVSSSLVRQLAALGSDIRPYVPHVVATALQPDGPVSLTPATT